MLTLVSNLVLISQIKTIMKTFLFVVVAIFASCSGEDDPGPNCEQLKKDSDHAHADYQAATNVPLLPSASDAAVKEWQANVETKKDIYVEKYKLWNEHCK